MNYFELHIGDFDSATAHLSMLEDGVYSRLLRVYYRTEAPLPADIKQVCRLVRAASKAERDCVATVLEEFFELREDGWHNARCDEEISRYHETLPDREARRENDRERQRRSRERRKHLFDSLRSHGIVPAFDAKTSELEALLSRANVTNVTRDTSHPVTRDNTATHTPSPNHQYPEERNTPLTPTVTDVTPTAAGRMCRHLKDQGVMVSPGNPLLLALLKAGATSDEFDAFVPQALQADNPGAYLLKTLTNARVRAAEQGAQMHRGEMPASQRREQPAETAYQRSMRERVASFAPEIAAKPPGARRAPQPVDVIDLETPQLEHKP